jgi:hypothetical protein
MKKIFRNNRLIAAAFLTVFSLSAASPAMAMDNKDVPASLNYVGQMEKHQIFQLSVAGDVNNDEFTIYIKDEYGNQVYREIIKSSSFTKRFLFDAEELSNSPLHFEIYSKKAKKSIVYSINSNIDQVEKIAVTQIQ